ncbi:hypothetical protein ACPUER_11980 [Burkholderia sp. DN3021]
MFGTYRGIRIKKTAQTYQAVIAGRVRWGTLAELQADIDSHLRINHA